MTMAKSTLNDFPFQAQRGGHSSKPEFATLDDLLTSIALSEFFKVWHNRDLYGLGGTVQDIRNAVVYAVTWSKDHVAIHEMFLTWEPFLYREYKELALSNPQPLRARQINTNVIAIVDGLEALTHNKWQKPDKVSQNVTPEKTTHAK